MSNLILILYLIARFVFGYGNITENELLTRIGIFSIVPCILCYYFLENKKTNLTYVVALMAVYIGDITFNKTDLKVDLISVSGFIFFNLIMIVIVFERIKYLKLRKVLLTTHLLVITLISITYFITQIFDTKLIIISIYLFSLSLLCSLCISYYVKSKSKDSLYFLIGVLSYIIASISKQYEYIEKTTALIVVINVCSYLSAQYFYCKAILENDIEHINQKNN